MVWGRRLECQPLHPCESVWVHAGGPPASDGIRRRRSHRTCTRSQGRSRGMPDRWRLAGIRRRTSHSRVTRAGDVRGTTWERRHPAGIRRRTSHSRVTEQKPCAPHAGPLASRRLAGIRRRTSHSRVTRAGDVRGPPGSAGILPASDVERAIAVYGEQRPCAPHAGPPASPRRLASNQPYPYNASRLTATAYCKLLTGPERRSTMPALPGAARTAWLFLHGSGLFGAMPARRQRSDRPH
jgi:hypothetical protein